MLIDRELKASIIISIKKKAKDNRVHTGAVIGKTITNLFYNRNFTKSYYIGCSTGGRQGFQSAQMFPKDFDGIVAGSPTLAFTQLTAWAGWLGLVTGYNTKDSGFISPNLWKTIHQEILKQCDGLDGAIDGYVMNIAILL